jgi:hypothetical protein
MIMDFNTEWTNGEAKALYDKFGEMLNEPDMKHFDGAIVEEMTKLYVMFTVPGVSMSHDEYREFKKSSSV